MIVCKNEKDYNILKTLRSHGWSRNTIFHKYYKKKYKNIDERFLFIGPGYNLRPTDIQAAIAKNQFKRLGKFMKIRNANRNKIISGLINHPMWHKQFIFIQPNKNITLCIRLEVNPVSTAPISIKAKPIIIIFIVKCGKSIILVFFTISYVLVGTPDSITSFFIAVPEPMK